MIKLAVSGAAGRTGRAVLAMALADEQFEITAALTEPADPFAGSSIRIGDGEVLVVKTLDVPCDVLVDFSVAAGTMAWLGVCRERGIPMVIGATGHDDDQLARIRRVADAIPVLKATNFAVGIQAILNVIGRLATELGEAYDTEIVEAHHRHKVDAPSGTALTLAEQIARAKGGDSKSELVFGRRGQVGERPTGQIGIHAVRMGEGVGWHEVHFSGPGETVTIRHAAHSRDTFAAGALRAAAWIIDKPPGLYSMRDVIS